VELEFYLWNKKNSGHKRGENKNFKLRERGLVGRNNLGRKREQWEKGNRHRERGERKGSLLIEWRKKKETAGKTCDVKKKADAPPTASWNS